MRSPHHPALPGAALAFALALSASQQPGALSGADPTRSAYVLAPNDRIVLTVPQAEELAGKPFRIAPDGFLNLPLAGKVRAAGLTLEQLEAALAARLKAYIREPLVTVDLVEASTRSPAAPVFVVGAFRTPGVLSLDGSMKVSDALVRAGGLHATAARRVRLTRRAEAGAIPAPGAVSEDAGRSVLDIAVRAPLEVADPAQDVELKPFDVLSVAKTEMIFVSGAVAKAGAYPLDDREYLTAAQVLALAGGLAPNARPEHALVLRPVLETARRAAIPLDLKRILAGQANDFPLLPNDVVMVPRSRGSALKWLGGAGVSAAVTGLVYAVVR